MLIRSPRRRWGIELALVLELVSGADDLGRVAVIRVEFQGDDQGAQVRVGLVAADQVGAGREGGDGGVGWCGFACAGGDGDRAGKVTAGDGEAEVALPGIGALRSGRDGRLEMRRRPHLITGGDGVAGEGQVLEAGLEGEFVEALEDRRRAVSIARNAK